MNYLDRGGNRSLEKFDVFEFKGSYYEKGIAHGRRLHNSKHFQHMISNIKEMFFLRQDVKEIKNVLTCFCPQLLDELEGLQVGFNYTEAEVLRLFSGYDTPPLKMGCTSFITNDYYVRNYDFSPAFYDGTLVIHRDDRDGWLCGNSEFILGRLDGMNHHGLTCGLHFVNNDLYKKGFIGSAIVRIALEMCENTEDALSLLKELPHAASYNYSLLDRSGNFAVFEASPDAYNIYREENSLSCVNTFQTNTMKVYNKKNIDSSLNRLEALSHFSKVIRPVNEVHNWFSCQTSPVFYTDYEDFFGTLHTVSYVPSLSNILLTSYDGQFKNISL